MLLMRAMPVKAAWRLVAEQDTRLWRVLMHYVEVGRGREDFSEVKPGRRRRDEPPPRPRLRQRLHRSRSLQGIFATPSREKKLIGEFKTDLEAHYGKAPTVVNFSADLW